MNTRVIEKKTNKKTSNSLVICFKFLSILWSLESHNDEQDNILVTCHEPVDYTVVIFLAFSADDHKRNGWVRRREWVGCHSEKSTRNMRQTVRWHYVVEAGLSDIGGQCPWRNGLVKNSVESGVITQLGGQKERKVKGK